jgi:hypothetical protein
MELINTTYRDNQPFYGRAKGSATFAIVGYQYDMHIGIDAKASTTDSSYITLPPAKQERAAKRRLWWKKSTDAK